MNYSDDEDSLPEGWSQYYDSEQNSFYYVNNSNSESQWERPSKESKELQTYPRVNTFHSDTNYYSDVENDKYSDVDEDTYSYKNEPEIEIRDEIDDFRKKSNITTNSTITGGTNQDYLYLTKLYRMQRPYSDIKISQICILCNRNVVTDAFFPCNHRCVCKSCINKEEIKEHSSRNIFEYPHAHFNCPLCAGIIKKIITCDNGREEEKYWNWVNEIKPPLPVGFEKRFGHAAAAITTVYVNNKDTSKTCIIG